MLKTFDTGFSRHQSATLPRLSCVHVRVRGCTALALPSADSISEVCTEIVVYLADTWHSLAGDRRATCGGREAALVGRFALPRY